MPRFFAHPRDITADQVFLDPETLAHLRVLRLRPDETFIICDGEGTDYTCVLHTCAFDGELAQIISSAPNEAEPSIDCPIYLAYTRGERMDYAIQKSVEMGATRIILFPSERCVVKYESKALPKKLTRWEKIAEEAAKQSGRGRIPAVETSPSFKEAMTQAAEADCPLFFYEGEQERTLRMALDRDQKPKSVSLVIGSEGGFAEQERDLAVELGLIPVTLGKRILRCETAPIAALAGALLYLED